MNLTTEWQVIDSYEWIRTSGAKVTFYLEAKYSSQSIANNSTYVDTRLRSVLNSGSISGSGYRFTLTYASNREGTGVWNFDTETILTGGYDVPHENDGTKSLTLTATVYNSNRGLNETLQATVTLPTIPRKSIITNYDVTAVDEGTIGITWYADKAVDEVQYSINNGTWITGATYSNAFGGYFPKAAGMTAGSTFNVKIRVKNQASQLWSDESLNKPVTLYDYPKPISITDFVIGSGNCNVNLYNPLGRNITLQLISNNDGSVIGNYTGTYNGIVSAEFNTASAINSQYASIPNSKSGTYYAKVTYGSSIKTSGNATYRVTENEIPTVSLLVTDNDKTLSTGYKTVTNLTGNNKHLIKYISNATVLVNASGNNSATISSYSTRYNSIQQSGQTYTYSNVETLDFGGTATDSRGLSNSATTPNDVTLIPYVKPSLDSVEFYRQNETSSTLYCKGSGNYYSGSFGLVSNSITFQVRYKESGTTSWSNWETKSVTVGNNNNYSFDFQVGTAFEYTKNYIFQFQITDKCMTTDIIETIAKAGLPVLGLYETFIETFGTKLVEKINNKVIVKNIEYSTTEEVKTGELWINGKPIYTKSVELTNIQNTLADYISITSFIANPWYIWIDLGNSFYYSSGSSGPISDWNTVDGRFNSSIDSSRLYYKCNDLTYNNAVITLKYTKSTD